MKIPADLISNRNLGIQKMICHATFLLLVACSVKSTLKAQTSTTSVSWGDILRQVPDWYGSPEALQIADNVLVYQHRNGGWPKNKDMAKLLSEIEVNEIKQAQKDRESEFSRTTIDNGATHTQIRFLARVFHQQPKPKYKRAIRKGIHYLLDAQYPNGGWPQFFPLREGYYSQITYNDGAMTGVLQVLQELVSDSSNFAALKLGKPLKQKISMAFDRGVDCILKTQVYLHGKPTVWCAQHDRNTLAPAKARSYELPSLSGAESVGIILLLMSIDKPSPKIIAAVDGAVAWLETHKIKGIRVEKQLNAEGKSDKVVVKSSGAPPLWGRFYDLDTQKAYFCSRDGIKRNTLAEISYERRNGYRWYTSAPQKVLHTYPAWRNNLQLD